MQVPPVEGSFYQEEFYPEDEPISEDCLFLNVWTASSAADAGMPVMMWIHGGAFTQGSGSMPLFDGTALAEKGVIAVTISYRLGLFGLLAHPELTEESEHASSGNYGLLDQVAALEAFFIHPDWARRGMGRQILEQCERDAGEAGFRSLELVATLPGEPFYEALGFTAHSRQKVGLTNGAQVETVTMYKSLFR
jgi:GNAT superfamily N-acetyltransferase